MSPLRRRLASLALLPVVALAGTAPLHARTIALGRPDGAGPLPVDRREPDPTRPPAVSPPVSNGPTTPQSGHFRLLSAELTAEIQSALDRARAAYSIPGLSFGVAFDDGRRWLAGSGVADLVSAAPVGPATIFPVASITKTYTASLVLRLAEEGRLSLDDPVSRWVADIPNGERLTIRHLLNHTSGLRDFWDDERRAALLADPARRWTGAELLAGLGQPHFEPGTWYSYSNTNYVVLGLVVERVTGQPIGTALNERLLAPLGLDRTFLQPDDGAAPADADRAQGHALLADVDGDGRADPTANRGPVLLDDAWSTAFSTSGAVAASADELLAFGQALFGGRVVSAASLAAMSDFTTYDYGMGLLRVWPDEQTAVGHTGGLRGFVSLMLRFPDRGFTVVLLANRDRIDGLEVLRYRAEGAPSVLDILLRPLPTQ